MGRAIIDDHGDDPVRRFQSDMAWIDSAALHGAVTELLRGKVVTNDDDDVTVTCTGSTRTGDGFELMAREALKGERVRLIVHPRTPAQLVALGVKARAADLRAYTPPPPGPHRTVEAPDTPREATRWELFNCIIVDVEPIDPPPPLALAPDLGD